MLCLIVSSISVVLLQQVSKPIQVSNNTSLWTTIGWSAVSPASLPTFQKYPTLQKTIGNPSIPGRPGNTAPYSAASGLVPIDSTKNTFIVVIAEVMDNGYKQKVIRTLPVKFNKDGSLVNVKVTSIVTKTGMQINLFYN